MEVPTKREVFEHHAGMKRPNTFNQADGSTGDPAHDEMNPEQDEHALRIGRILELIRRISLVAGLYIDHRIDLETTVALVEKTLASMSSSSGELDSMWVESPLDASKRLCPGCWRKGDETCPLFGGGSDSPF